MSKITKNSTYIPIQHNKKSVLNCRYTRFSPAKLVQGFSARIKQNLVKKGQVLSKQDKNRQKQAIFASILPAKLVQVACEVGAGIFFATNYFNLLFLSLLLNVFTNVTIYIAKNANFNNKKNGAKTMKNRNLVFLIGFISKINKLRIITTSNKELLSFSVATNKEWVDDKGKVKKITQFHNVFITGKKARILANNLKIQVGDYVDIEGEIQYSESFSIKIGAIQNYTNIIAKEVSLLARKEKVNKEQKQ